MTEQSKWVSDDINQALLQGILDFITRHIARLHSSQRAQEVSQAICTMQAELEHQYASWLQDGPSKFHLRFMSLLLAGYRTLSELMPIEEALMLVKTAVIELGRQTLTEGVKSALDYASDPMVTLVDASKQREEFFFGNTFSFERCQDDEQAYIVHVKRCFFHQFALANDAPELMQVLCEWDWIWADAIEPDRHGFTFERPTTLGYDGDKCQFCFRRRAK